MSTPKKLGGQNTGRPLHLKSVCVPANNSQYLNVSQLHSQQCIDSKSAEGEKSRKGWEDRETIRTRRCVVKSGTVASSVLAIIASDRCNEPVCCDTDTDTCWACDELLCCGVVE